LAASPWRIVALREEADMRVQKSIEIAAPPERVWPFFVEPEKVLQWCTTFRKFEYTGTQHSGIGTPLYIEEQAGGRLSKMQFEITEWKENEKLALRMVSGASYPSYVQEFSLEPCPAGSRCTFKEDITLPYGAIGRLLGLMGERMSRSTVDKMEAQLKHLVEA
jgi:carbon monoxide dehydrogenase subunit G